jgi:uncharacterized membrane protein YciS (DUF1049 family)
VRIIKLFLLLLVVAVGLILHSRNPQPVSLDYYVGIVTKPLSLFLAISVLIGAVLGILACLWPILSLKTENLRLRRQLRNSAKTLPERSDTRAPDA